MCRAREDRTEQEENGAVEQKRFAGWTSGGHGSLGVGMMTNWYCGGAEEHWQAQKERRFPEKGEGQKG